MAGGLGLPQSPTRCRLVRFLLPFAFQAVLLIPQEATLRQPALGRLFDPAYPSCASNAVATGSEEAGFWPVISRPSLTA